MNRASFFAVLRGTSLFKTLSSPQVVGMEAILDACQKYTVSRAQHVAYIMANVYRETGGYMSPIKETVMPYHTDKNPSDGVVIDRLNAAFNNGKLPWVKDKYWEQGWFGRGPIQVTHKENYQKLGDLIGIDLVADPSKVLTPAIGAETAVMGMTRGVFTGKKLIDYEFPRDLQAVPSKNPRRIVNGNDGTDAEVASNYKIFYDALVGAGYGEPDTIPVAPPTPVDPPQRTRYVVIAEIEALLAELKSLGG